MTFKKVLIANRGEVSIRIARALAELGIASVAIFSKDDEQSLHVKHADEAFALEGVGVAAYLDASRIITLAKDSGCDAIHPGYGFLSERADFARACAEAGLTFIGPEPATLEVFGDKAKARDLAETEGVPLLPGTKEPVSLDQVKIFFEAQGPAGAVMIKAIAGGGGRGMRPVYHSDDIKDAYERCRSEAKAAFGDERVYVERLVKRARHLEVQIIGDGEAAIQLGERECSIQRRHQKLVEIAPSPTLSSSLRNKLFDAALKLASATGYKGLGTVEFLVEEGDDPHFYFMETNPRLQVEHTVTEEVTGVDLVKAQIRIAAGATLEQIGLKHTPEQRGHAIQVRLNMEEMQADGSAKPTGGILSSFIPSSGPGVRVDTFGYSGYGTNPNYDSLLAKLICWTSGSYRDTVAKTRRALQEFNVAGVGTNRDFLLNLLDREEFAANDIYTDFLADKLEDLLMERSHSHALSIAVETKTTATLQTKVTEGPTGTHPVSAPMQARIVSVDVREGDLVAAGQQVAVLDAMKMEHVITASEGGLVRQICVEPDETVFEGHPLIFVELRHVETESSQAMEAHDLERIRPDLAEVIERHSFALDENRPDAVERRRKRNQRTVRENIAQLCDEDSFIEYGALAVAAQRSRRDLDDLIRNTPADGMVTGIGSINGDQFGDEQSRAAVLAYDFTVLAGTQGAMNHKKTDRLLHVIEQWNLPTVLYAEGGGGRPGDTDIKGVAGLDVTSFQKFATMSGRVPLIGVVSGRCFAGNAALLGCCDVIIATEDSNIGMGGPAMIEGGGLGTYRPEEVGPFAVQRKNGVIDIPVKDEIEATEMAKKYLSYFQGPLEDWEAEDQRHLRNVIPENRLRAYDIRKVIHALCDKGSVLELRPDFGVGILTCLVRIEGRPMGLIANNPFHLGGAIDADAADKTARFMQLCDAFDIPMLSLCDTPGFMVGPDVEETAQVRHVSRLFVTAASMTVPTFTVVLRKGYGLGAQAMAAGCFHAPFFNISWPTGEFGGMGLEGAVRLGFKKEIEAIEDPKEQQEFYQKMVDASYERGKAINMASYLEIDGVIDPKDTRHWVMRGLKSVPPKGTEMSRNRSFVDTW